MAEKHSSIKSCVLDENGNITQSKRTRGISASSKKTGSQTKKSSDKGKEVYKTDSEDSLLAAENLLRDIDSATGRRAKVHINHVNLGSITSTGSLRDTNNVKITSRKQSRLAAFHKTGQIDLDAVEKWVSTPEVDLDLNKTEKAMDVSVPKRATKNESVSTKMKKADSAVEEIGTIIGTDPTNGTQHGLKQTKINNNPSTSFKPSNSASVSSTSSKNKHQMTEGIPAPSFPCPIQSIRLPPVNSDSFKKEDIFHRTITDMSVLHLPHHFPNLDVSNRNPVSEIQKITETADNLHKSLSAGRPSENVSDYLLPGQVPDHNTDQERKEGIEIRYTVLDYSASEPGHKKKRCGLFKLCTRFSCCRGQKYEIEEFQQENFESRTNTAKKTKRGSIPGRLWRRVKKCFGF
ncbi:uncharacterized protein LOC123528743 [Mercenaria mercenaria]|uniref:uncharacterized protein LOC123528743 n=1 Tax=Mercenaria mercenaria TaxID=6596 RepID=UPI00234F302D|nr:uncharacterized protein LOC123528743 [Mercenaria mercenaria]